MNSLYNYSLRSISFMNRNHSYHVTINKILSIERAPTSCKSLGILSFHTSSKLDKFIPPKPRPTVYKKPVDWLPFPWHRRPKFNLYSQGGDNIKDLVYDLEAPKPDFEYSEALKNANETVKRTFSLATANKDERRERMQRDLLAKVQRHPFDFDSLEVKITLKTVRIRSLYEHHARLWRREARVSRLILPILIMRRNGLLNKLRKIDEERFNWILGVLDLSFTPPTIGLKTERYCKKWDLRRMTKEYCDKMIAEKKQAYHEELKKEQEEFLEEKRQALAWIEAEEKALKELETV